MNRNNVSLTSMGHLKSLEFLGVKKKTCTKQVKYCDLYNTPFCLKLQVQRLLQS